MDDFQSFIVWTVFILNPVLITGKLLPPENIRIFVRKSTARITWKITQPDVGWVRLSIRDAQNKTHTVSNGQEHIDIPSLNTSFEISTLPPCDVYIVNLYSMPSNGKHGQFSESVQKKFWLVARNVTGDLNANVTVTWKTKYSNIFKVKSPKLDVIYELNPEGVVLGNDKRSKYIYNPKPVNVQDIELTVINVNKTDGGIYKSVSDIYSVGSIDECQLLIIAGKPTNPSLTLDPRNPFVGDDIRLRCRSDVQRWPMVDTSSLIYKFSGLRTEQQQDGVLIVRNVSKSYNGSRISCQAIDDRNIKSNRSDVITLNIYYGPENLMVLPLKRSITKILNSSLGPIQCSAKCNPECEISWRKDNTKIETTNGTLLISRIKKTDGGIYQCTATNPKNTTKSVNQNVNVTVLYPPSIVYNDVSVNGIKQQTTNPYKYREGDIVQIRLAIESNPTANLTLKSTGFQSSYLQFNKSGEWYTFHLPPLECENSGFFFIEADNGINKSAQWKTQFDIQCQPKKVKLHSEKIGTKLGANETILLILISNPKPRIEWHKQSSNLASWKLQQDKETYNYKATSAVNIRNEDDLRTYTILIENQLGTTLRNVTFIPRGKPEQPTNFSYENVTFRQATLLWTAGFDGGGTQNFTIFYKYENDDNFKGPVEVEATDTRKGTKIHYILRGLLSLTSYDVVLVATNEYGTINISLQFTTEAEPVLTSPLLTKRPIFIGAVAGVAVLVLALFICFIAKMKKGGNDSRSTNVRTDKSTKKKSKEKLANNDIIPGQSNTEYACVNKSASKGLQRKDDSGNSNAEYSCVNKSTSKEPQKEDTQENTEYAVVDKTHKNTVFDGENQYANRLDDSSPIINLESKSPGRRVNDDGLVYIEVVFPKNKSDRKPIIIHGDENRTNYVDIDFTKKAEPLSESGND